MRLVVEVSPRGEEGPLAIEIASDRRLTLPACAYAPLGVRFTTVE
jgi:hypothetical protein